MATNENIEINVDEFNAKMESVTTEAEEAAVLQEFGLCVPGTESAESGELSEEQLGDVTGGAQWRPIMSQVPVFNHIPGDRFSSPQRIIGIRKNSDVIFGKLVKDGRGFPWIQLRNGGFVSASHLSCVSG